jgi:hypothetical protein
MHLGCEKVETMARSWIRSCANVLGVQLGGEGYETFGKYRNWKSRGLGSGSSDSWREPVERWGYRNHSHERGSTAL